MSNNALTRQGKNHSAAPDTRVAESTHKAAHGAQAAARMPAWTSAWGDHPIIGLPSPIASLQTKGILSQPGDSYEQEADQVAEQVMHLTPPASLPMAPPPDSPVASSSFANPLSYVGPMIQRAPVEGEATSPPATDTPTPEAASTSEEATTGSAPEAATASPTATPGLIVEDSMDQLQAGQMKKSDFLAQLRDAVCTTTEEALRGTIWSAAGCPWIDHWFSYYSSRDSQQIERALRRYAPETANATSASDYIPIICERVRRAIAVWSTTGEVTGVPEGMELPGAGLLAVAGSIASGIASVGSTIASGAESVVSGIASAGASIVSGVGSALSGIGYMLFKGKEGGPGEVSNPQAIRGHLSSGSALDSRVKAPMEQAFGVNFSQVRVHTDATAAGLSESLNARAFTIGQDVAFGAGEYRPGTVVGDALIAHELAHVVQQRGASPSGEPVTKGGTVYNLLEEDADRSAVGAMVSLWSGAKGGLVNIAQNALPTMRSGLGLQRCPGTQPRVQGPTQRQADFASMTAWQLARTPEAEFSTTSSGRVPTSGPGLADYARASRLARALLTFDIDTPPGPGREPTEDELRILDQNLSQILSSNNIRSLVARPGRTTLATQEGASRATLRGHVRVATREAFAAGRYRLEMLVGGINPSSPELNDIVTRLWNRYHIPSQTSARVTNQERRMAVYYNFLIAPPIPNGFYQVTEDTIYIPDFVDIRSATGTFLARHETVHLLGGGERTRQAFIRRFGADWQQNWWVPFEEGVAELIAIQSLPAGQSPPPPPEIQISPDVTVTGERYEQYVQWAQAMTANREDRDLVLRAYFTGEVPERVFALLAQAKGVPLPPPPR